jgi:hypothetical protein
MYTYSPENTQVPTTNLVTRSFVAGFVELYEIASTNPNLRMIPIEHYDLVKSGLKQLGFRTRIRYRGPHAQQRDTHKADARAFTVYFQDRQFG